MKVRKLRRDELEVPVSATNPAIVKDDRKCITCGYCKAVCRDEITVAALFDAKKLAEPICINCGQCAMVCPMEAIHERYEYRSVKRLLHAKNGRTVAFSVAPAVRAALAEEFGLKKTNYEGKIAAAIRALGADYAFDVTFGADLTIMEEAAELKERILDGGVLPQFTSCCPAWVKYAETFYPELITNLSTAKSPISMQGTLIKTCFAEKKGIDPKKLVHVVIAPCTAKKFEIRRPELSETRRDNDYLLTTREFARLLKEEGIDVRSLKEENYDSPLGLGTGAGVIFGNTGGVAEAALRTAYYLITGKNLEKNDLNFTAVRGMQGLKETTVTILGKEIRVAVCNGMSHAKELIDRLLNNEVYYDFIEVMNCPGGCIAGGGQPKMTLLLTDKTKAERTKVLYDEDEAMTLRMSHENPDVKRLYEEYLGEPNSPKAEELLHTCYLDRSASRKPVKKQTGRKEGQ